MTRWRCCAAIAAALLGWLALAAAVDLRSALASKLRERESAAPNLQDMKQALQQLQNSIASTDAVVAAALAGASVPSSLASPAPQASLSPARAPAERLRFHGSSMAASVAAGPSNVNCGSPCPSSVQCGSCGSSCPCCCGASQPRELGPLSPVKTARDLSFFAPCASPCPADVSCAMCDQGGPCHCCCHPSNSHLRSIHEHDEDNVVQISPEAPCADCPQRSVNWTFPAGQGSNIIVAPHTVLKLEAADGEDPEIKPYVSRANNTVPPGELGANGARIIKPHYLIHPLYDDEQEDAPAGKVRPRIESDGDDDGNGDRHHRHHRHRRHGDRDRDDDGAAASAEAEGQPNADRDAAQPGSGSPITPIQSLPSNQRAESENSTAVAVAEGSGAYPGYHVKYRLVLPCESGLPCASDSLLSPSDPPNPPSLIPPTPPASIPLPPLPRYPNRDDEDGDKLMMPLGTVPEAVQIMQRGEGLEPIPLPPWYNPPSKLVPAMPLPDRDDSVVDQHRRYLQQWESGFA